MSTFLKVIVGGNDVDCSTLNDLVLWYIDVTTHATKHNQIIQVAVG